MIKNKIGIGSLILAIMLIGMALIPAVSAQKEDNYSVTAEEAFKHATHQALKTGQGPLLIPIHRSFMT
ncbi:hypothetical protein [Methanosarcina mazei]|uniref:hypothetical protein n=1 Tax=Methanosarcina mazei TaxID=2209 RepID=UPI000A900061|nr:hypothetical protein [Methanosarcina mazei]